MCSTSSSRPGWVLSPASTRVAASVAAGLCAIVLACREQPRATSPPLKKELALDWVRFRRSDLRSDKVSAIPIAEMREYVSSSYRLVPDRRFLFALGEVRRLVSGKPAPELAVGLEKDRWMLRYDSVLVGSLPQFPSFPQLLSLLTSMAEQSLKGARLPNDSQPKAPRPADDRLKAFFAPNLIEVLEEIDRRPSRSASWETAARALVLLRVQTFDRLDISDPLSARALATLALAKAAGSQGLLAEEALLADQLGYETDARLLATDLPPSDPVRAFVLHDEASLLAAADSQAASRLAQFLAAKRIAQKGDVGAWASWIHKHHALYTNLFSSPVIGTALEADEFGYARVLPGAIRAASLWALLPASEKKGVTLPSGDPTNADVPSEMDQFSRAVWTGLVLDEAGALRRFETALDAAAGRARGPIVDGLLLRSYFGAGFYSGVYETGRFLLDLFASAVDAAAFAESLGQPRSAVASDLKRWIEDRAAVYLVKKPHSLLLTDIRELRTIGLVPVLRMRRTAFQYLYAQLVERRGMARDLFARMDSRPGLLGDAARMGDEDPG